MISDYIKKNYDLSIILVSHDLDLVYKYQVSPVHLVDILGEYVDQYVSDFNI